MITVIKRDGRETEFSKAKIFYAVKHVISDPNVVDNITEAVCEKIIQANVKSINVEDIQNVVETTLVDFKYIEEARQYITYRQKRTIARNSKTALIKTMHDIVSVKSGDLDLKRENANINTDAPMGMMLKIGSEMSKYYTLNFLLKPEHAEAHRSGDIHIHDLDFYPMTLNCCQIDIGKLLSTGFHTGHGFIRPPQTIQTAANLCCIIVQSNQNDMFRQH